VKTASGGEIDVIDSGAFGTVTVTKSMTIDGSNAESGVLAPGTNGVTVNAAPTDRVTIRGLDINGAGTGVSGIRVLAARSVKIVDNDIYGFTGSGILISTSTTNSRTHIARNFIHDNTGAGVTVLPGNGVFTKATLRRNEIVETGCGLVVTQYGAGTAGQDCGTGAAGTTSGAAIVNAFDNSFTDNSGAGVFARGSSVLIRIGRNFVLHNGFGLQSVDGGNILSWGNNRVAGNSVDGNPTGPIIPPMSRDR
jgi:hypothetical protein